MDQRGNGPRRGSPDLPENIIRLDSPTLTFRPDLGQRQRNEVLKGEDWENMAKAMSLTLGNALGTLRGAPRKVRVFGYAQTGLMWTIGRHFDRTTSAELYGYDKDGLAVTNKDQERHTPLTGGNPDRSKLIAGSLDAANGSNPTIALGIGIQERYGAAVQQAVPDIPLFWIEAVFIDGSQEAMQLVADIVASVERLRRDHSLRELMLFWTTANHVALLAAANLTSHVVPTIRFMEWDHASAEYVELPMP
ncbi:MAG: hypothetical protein AAGA83_17730 [Cyanobacteria bacterium P01_F01_bin.116]